MMLAGRCGPSLSTVALGGLSSLTDSNDDIESSGLDMFDPADFVPTLAIGYPTIHAWVHDDQRNGYRTADAFIQWLDIERVALQRRMSPS